MPNSNLKSILDTGTEFGYQPTGVPGTLVGAPRGRPGTAHIGLGCRVLGCLTLKNRAYWALGCSVPGSSGNATPSNR